MQTAAAGARMGWGALSGHHHAPWAFTEVLFILFVRADLIPDKRTEMISAHHRVIPRLMTIPSAFFRKAVLEGKPYPVHGCYGMCTNPMIAWADSWVNLHLQEQRHSLL